MRQTAPEKRLAQEQAYPENFEDGADWIRLAGAAAGTAIAGLDEGTAGLRQEYESARLRGRFLTLDGVAAVEDAMRTHIEPLRAAQSPIMVGRHKVALQVLTEARKKPSARATWGRVLTAANVGGLPEFAYRRVITSGRPPRQR